MSFSEPFFVINIIDVIGLGLGFGMMLFLALVYWRNRK